MSSEDGQLSPVKERVLTAEDRARIERNRQRALLIRQSKQVKLSTRQLNKEVSSSNAGKDSGGGFLISENEEEEQVSSQNSSGGSNSQDFICEECGEEIKNSFLKQKYDVNVCYKCSKEDVRYELITRTDAKSEYLLKDCDLDKREPPLKYILKKNPNPLARSEMKLYLRAQVEDRALEVWESEDRLEEERSKRNGKRKDRQEKKYQKRMNELRMAARSSLFKKKSITHEHEFSEEVYNEDLDRYEKMCKTCDHLVFYEKM